MESPLRFSPASFLPHIRLISQLDFSILRGSSRPLYLLGLCTELPIQEQVHLVTLPYLTSPTGYFYATNINQMTRAVMISSYNTANFQYALNATYHMPIDQYLAPSRPVSLSTHVSTLPPPLSHPSTTTM